MQHLKTLCLATAALAATSMAGAASAVTIIAAGTPGTTGDTGLYLDSLSSLTTSDATATTTELNAYLGAPDDIYVGLGQASITYDLGGYRLINGSGADFNVYEYNAGAVEFHLVNIELSADNVTWHNVDTDVVTFADLAGDEAHGNAAFRRSYDVGNALSALGVSKLRYVRLTGLAGSATISGSSGFDPDAVGFRNFSAPPIPEPASWALMIAGFGLIGGTLRRRAGTLRLA